MSEIEVRRRLERLERELAQLRGQLGSLPVRPAKGGAGGSRLVLGDDVLAIGAVLDGGESELAAREDHVHTFTPSWGTPVSIGQSNAEGNATTFARSNHVHANNLPIQADVKANLTTTNVRVGTPGGTTSTNRGYIYCGATLGWVCITHLE